MRVVCPNCGKFTNLLNERCDQCGVILSVYFEPYIINTARITKLRKHDEFLNSLNIKEFSFIVSILGELNKTYMNKLIYETGKTYFGIKYLFDATFIRFYFAKVDGKFIYKYRKASFNCREVTELDNLDEEMFKKVLQRSIISLTYRYSYEHDQEYKNNNQPCK